MLEQNRFVQVVRASSGAWLAASLLALWGCGGPGTPRIEARLSSQTGYPLCEWTGESLDRVDTFVVYRSDGGGAYQAVGQIGFRSRNYLDKFDAVEGVEYRYQVAGARGGAELARSPEGPATSTRSLPETTVVSYPDKPLTVLNEADIKLAGTDGANPVTGFLFAFDYFGRVRAKGDTVELRALSAGPHRIVAWAQDAAGNLDITPPSVTFDVNVKYAPKLFAVEAGKLACTRERQVMLRVDAKDVADLKLSENSDLAGAEWQPIPADKKIAFSISEGEGAKKIYGRFRTSAGAESLTVSDTVFYDVTPPVIHVTQPTAGIVTSHTTITVTGTFLEDSPIDPPEVNMVYSLIVGMDGFMRPLFPLLPGINTIDVMIRDCAGNESHEKIEITRDPNAPAGNCGT